MPTPRLSIIIPVLNEAATLAANLRALQPLRQPDSELIVVDGGSRDASVAIAVPLVDRLLTTLPGRALQMNAGAAVARGELLWFLHSDTRPPAAAISLIHQALAEPGGRVWGRFDVRLTGRQPLLRVVETLMNYRSRLTGIATGDQGIFVRRQAFTAVGGYPPIALMEDVALSRRLKQCGRPVCLSKRLLTSSRRWERNGILYTILLMWRLRLAYWLGADPTHLAHRYYGHTERQ